MASLALVTGASSGIGEALARDLHARGVDLLLTADDEPVHRLAAELGATGLQADLTDPAEVERVGDAAAWADLVLLNAGIAVGGAFGEDADLRRALALCDLNVRATVHLAGLLLPRMRERGEGRLLITSSIAATSPGPFQAAYNASKAFLQSFGAALQEELRDSGVTVTLLMPGPTDTPIWDRGDLETSRIGASEHKSDAADVARQGVEALLAGRDRVVGGTLLDRAAVAVGGVVPDRVKTAMHRVLSEPGQA